MQPSGGGETCRPPNLFDGPMLKPLNNYCWLCAFSSVPLTRNRAWNLINSRRALWCNNYDGFEILTAWRYNLLRLQSATVKWTAHDFGHVAYSAFNPGVETEKTLKIHKVSAFPQYLEASAIETHIKMLIYAYFLLKYVSGYPGSMDIYSVIFPSENKSPPK